MPGLNKRASNQTGTISIKMEDINEKEKVTMFCTNLMLAGVLCLTLAACGAKQSSDMPASDTESAVSTAPCLHRIQNRGKHCCPACIGYRIRGKHCPAGKGHRMPNVLTKTPIWQRATPTFTTTATIPTLRMKSCRSASIRRSMFPMKNQRERFACHLL